jgi:DNA-binding IclR family transcriptional regulator
MVNSVQKAFRVLKAFDKAQPRLTLTQIAAKLDVDKSTAQRFVHTLEAMGYLDKDSVTKTLGLSVKVLDLAHIYLTTSPLITTAIPYLMHLNQETGETVNLTVLDGPDVVFVSRLVGNHLLSTGVGVGTRLPAYCSAAGVAMLSVLEADELKKILDASELRLYTPQTIHEPPRIRERLKQTRSKGYAIGISEYFLNDISIGAPIIDRGGRPIGAISLAISKDRLSPKEAENAFASRVLAAAQSVRI